MARNNQDISNKTLALLVGVAIVVSLVGIFSMNGPTGITGAQLVNTTSQVGTTDFTLRSILSITLDDNKITFGEGRVENATNVTLDSFAATRVGGNSFNNTFNGTEPDSFRIRNSGTEDFSLDVNSSKNTSQLVDGDGGDGALAARYEFRVLNSHATTNTTGIGDAANKSLFNTTIVNDTARACVGGNSPAGLINISTFGNECGNFNTTDWNSATGAGTNQSFLGLGAGNCSPIFGQRRICDRVQFEDQQDELDFFLSIVVPLNTTAGNKTASITFLVTQA